MKRFRIAATILRVLLGWTATAVSAVAVEPWASEEVFLADYDSEYRQIHDPLRPFFIDAETDL